jgi:hypothetical protein
MLSLTCQYLLIHPIQLKSGYHLLISLDIKVFRNLSSYIECACLQLSLFIGLY